MQDVPLVWVTGLPGAGQEELAVALRGDLAVLSCPAIVQTGPGERQPEVVIHVTTPKWVCVERDVTGEWAEALQGRIRGFPGVDRRYVPPARVDHRADLHVETVAQAAERLADAVSAHLQGVKR